MIGLALRSLRYRAGGFAASFIAMFLGATILMAFASMLDTSSGSGVSTTDQETLTTMATVVGGWGLLIVVFAVASTLTLSVRQRSTEIALLKSIGATPAQIGRMIVGEAAVVAAVAALAAIAPAVLAGGVLLELLRDTDQVASGVSYSFGPIALGMGLGITCVASTIAALLTARRATRMRATEALVEASTGHAPMSRKRIVAAGVFLVIGLDLAVVTATVMRGEGVDAMATAGQASICFAIGLALLAPLLVRAVTARLAGPLERTAGVSGYLTALNVRQRPNQMASALMPIILFTGIATGTLYMQGIENAASSGVAQTAEEKSIETLNFVVVGMIAVFAAIMLINTLVAATTYRRQEFGQQRLAGSTPPQVLRMVSLESLVLVSTGVLFGSVAAIFTVVPYSIARTDSILPDATVATYLGIVSAAAFLVLASSLGATRRALRTPAVEAVAV
jgi:ABC-type antimicrobial peptide transport system permease subunit